MVHRRELNGQAIVLGNQGALWGNAMTWWDHETGSIWSQPLGEAIAGPLKGETLELLPVSLNDWSTWKGSHPDTLALDVQVGGPGGFDLQQMAIVVDFGSETAAYPIPELQAQVLVNDVVAGVPIAVVTDPTEPDSWVVFSRVLDDGIVTLMVDGQSILDIETGSVWDPVIGRAISGPREGQQLDVLPGFTSFPPRFFHFLARGPALVADGVEGLRA